MLKILFHYSLKRDGIYNICVIYIIIFIEHWGLIAQI